jgi:enoyl-CoA hydratase/carnithine racemase
VLASPTASFLDPHVSAGQVSGIEPPSLAMRLPLGIISRMALLGAAERLSAQRAYDLGMVSELVDGDALLDRAIALAEQLAAASPESVRRTRRVLRRLTDQTLEPIMRQGWDDVQDHWSHPDADEGPLAFAEKRPPVWAAPRRSSPGS